MYKIDVRKQGFCTETKALSDLNQWTFKRSEGVTRELLVTKIEAWVPCGASSGFVSDSALPPQSPTDPFSHRLALGSFLQITHLIHLRAASVMALQKVYRFGS